MVSSNSLAKEMPRLQQKNMEMEFLQMAMGHRWEFEGYY
jgi:hypothetical protein